MLNNGRVKFILKFPRRLIILPDHILADMFSVTSFKIWSYSPHFMQEKPR